MRTSLSDRDKECAGIISGEFPARQRDFCLKESSRRTQPLKSRKARLKKLVQKLPNVVYVDHVEERRTAFSTSTTKKRGTGKDQRHNHYQRQAKVEFREREKTP
jgi:hypothetical protein